MLYFLSLLLFLPPLCLAFAPLFSLSLRCSLPLSLVRLLLSPSSCVQLVLLLFSLFFSLLCHAFAFLFCLSPSPFTVIFLSSFLLHCFFSLLCPFSLLQLFSTLPSFRISPLNFTTLPSSSSSSCYPSLSLLFLPLFSSVILLFILAVQFLLLYLLSSQVSPLPRLDFTVFFRFLFSFFFLLTSRFLSSSSFFFIHSSLSYYFF